MNGVSNNILSISENFDWTFAKNVFSELSRNQKIIVLVSGVVIAIFAVYSAYKRFFHPSNRSTPIAPSQPVISQKQVLSQKQTTIQPPTKTTTKVSQIRLPQDKTKAPSTSTSYTKTQDVKITDSSQKDAKTNFSQQTHQAAPKVSHFSTSQLGVSVPTKAPSSQQQVEALIQKKFRPTRVLDENYCKLNELQQKIDILDEEMQKPNTLISSSDLSANLENALLNYPTFFGLYLESQDLIDPKREPNRSWIGEQILIFSGLLDRFSNHQEFVVEGLRSINSFLDKNYFLRHGILQWHKKGDLIVYSELFEILKRFAPELLLTTDPTDALLSSEINEKLAALPDDLNDLDDSKQSSAVTAQTQNQGNFQPQSVKLQSPPTSQTLPAQSTTNLLTSSTLQTLFLQNSSVSSSSSTQQQPGPSILIPIDLKDDATPADIDQFIWRQLKPVQSSHPKYLLCQAYNSIEILEKVIEDNAFNDTTMTNVKAKFDSLLQSYPKFYVDYLETCSSATASFAHEQTVYLSGLLDRQSHREDFVLSLFTSIDQFLDDKFFKNSVTFDETKTDDLTVLNECFDMVNRYLPVIQKLDDRLALRLKNKLANLPR